MDFERLIAEKAEKGRKGREKTEKTEEAKKKGGQSCGCGCGGKSTVCFQMCPQTGAVAPPSCK